MKEGRQRSILEDFFIREKPARVMLALKSSKDAMYMTKIAKETECTYSHLVKILNLLKSFGLVEFERKGRIKKIKLTDDGWEIAHNIEAMVKKFKIISDKIKADVRK